MSLVFTPVLFLCILHVYVALRTPVLPWSAQVERCQHQRCLPLRRTGISCNAKKSFLGATTTKEVWEEKDGQTVHKYTLTNASGMTIVVTEYGATIISVLAPDRAGACEEVTLTYPTLSEFMEKSPYYGTIAGRVANRIKNGKFELDGVTYDKLFINNAPNSLHGGKVGFDKKIWGSAEVEDGVEFTLTSPDGEEGYPGTVEARVTYQLTSTNDIKITFKATTDKATPINLTNHAYWNLSGNYKRKLYSQKLLLSCARYLPVDETAIPLGDLKPVAGTLFDHTASAPGADATTGKALQEALEGIVEGGMPGIDHCYVVDGAVSSSGTYANDGTMHHIATYTDPESGRQIVLTGTQPGVQVYTGNFLAKAEGDPAAPHVQHNGMCLETQHFPDSINQPQFPSDVLRPGQEYHHIATYSFKVTP